MRSFVARSVLAIGLCFGIVILVLLLDQPETNTNLNIIKSDCRFEKGVCKLALSEGQQLRFELSPADLPAMEPIDLTITGLADVKVNPSQFKIWFEGRDMQMGQHFMLPDQVQTDGARAASERLVFRGMIPVCTVDENMLWRLIVEYSEATRKQQIHFDIE